MESKQPDWSYEGGKGDQSEESLLSPSHSKASSISDEEDLSLREQDSIRKANLTPSERDSILRDASHNNKDDLKNFISSCAAEQFHSDASLEAVDRRALNNSKNWQWTTEGDVCVRRSTPAPHGGE
ncbi:GATOR complex protein NPRL3 [Trichonephila clavipes]|nr:GATOR complex protein NPRL3 [Trichonephila clavipes]